MLGIFRERLRQGFRTAAYPATAPALPERFRGLPVLDSGKCPEGCQECVEACPTGAMRMRKDRLTLDLGKCLFCVDCLEACPAGAIGFSGEYRLAARSREELFLDGRERKLAEALIGRRFAFWADRSSCGK